MHVTRLACLLGCLLLLYKPAAGQPFDPLWQQGASEWVKIGVVEDGIHRVTGQALANAGVDVAGISASTLKLFENGAEIPIHVSGDGVSFLSSDELVFVGHRNSGSDESWAYEDQLDRRSSSYYSLFSDTTYYWLSWGGADGARYTTLDPDRALNNPQVVATHRDTMHLEEDHVYYFGDSDDAGQPEYTRGEGYFWLTISHTDTSPIVQTFPLDLSGMTTNDSLIVEVRLSSGSLPRHNVQLNVTSDGAPLACSSCSDEADWNNYAFRTLRVAIPQSGIPVGPTIEAVITSNNDFNSFPNRVLIDYVRYTFMRTIDQSSGRFTSSGAGDYTFQLEGLAQNYWVLNPTSGSRFVVSGNDTLNDDPAASSTYWTAPEANFLTPVRIDRHIPVDWTDTSRQADYVVITSAALQSTAQAMADYRATKSGYSTLVINQQALFDQFDYGRPTALAVRRFVHASQNWATPPRFVTFWGDALRPEDERARRPLQEWEVISFGYAPADGWFGMGIDGPDDIIERPAIGRIPVRDNETGQMFIEKLTHYENGERDVWQKRLLLLVGGKTVSEQTLLQNRALEWGDHAASAPAGMDTLRFFKSTDSPLDPSFQDSLSQAFKNGASWVSYFGHSAADTWEIVTDAPENYDNADRLPIVLSMGCNTGNFAGGQFELTDRLVYGERLLLGSMNGAIAHWGSSSASTISLPARLANHLHETVFQDTMRVLGIAIQEAKRRFIEDAGPSATAARVLMQYGLIGDPALQVNLPVAPELTITPEAIAVSPIAPVTADSNLIVNLTVRNLGLVPSDSVDVFLQHQRPDGQTDDHAYRLAAFPRDTLLSVISPIRDQAGAHTFSASVDPGNLISEENEANNAAERMHAVLAAGLQLIDPIDFGVAQAGNVRLRAGFVAPQISLQTIAFELDTQASFDSSTKQSFEVQTNNIVADWRPTGLQTGIPYFWRARIVTEDDHTSWTTGHFTIEDAPSVETWRQSDAHFAENEQEPFLTWDASTRAWAFSPFDVNVRVTSERGNGFEKGQIVINGVRYERVTLGFGLAVLDGNTGALKAHNSFPTYRIPADLEERFNTDSTQAIADLTTFLADVDDGDYVFVRTRHLGNLSGPDMQEEVRDLFRPFGSAAIDTLDYTDLWIMMARAGAPGETREWTEPPGENFPIEIAQDTVLSFLNASGRTTTALIGPAASWDAIIPNIDLPNETSTLEMDILAADGTTVLLADVPANAQTSLAGIDATQHPLLQLHADFADPSQRATPQISDWSVAFTPLPEIAVDPGASSFTDDTLEAGEPFVIAASIRNIGNVEVPEAIAVLRLIDAENRESELRRDTLRSMAPDAHATLNITLDTLPLVGDNRLEISVEQPGIEERFPFNNLLIFPFHVAGDVAPPQFEVTIDNEAFPNDPNPVTNLQDPALPFVSARPEIEIILSDNSNFQLLNDTTLIQLRLDREDISFSHPTVTFEPATTEQNEARVFFVPDLSGRDTTHTLFVRVFDQSGNEGDGSPYQVHFRIQRAVEVESLYPYPNPMSEFTTFAFRLRGSDAGLADDFRLRIYTIAGRLIREFDLIDDPSHLEAGALRIGWNKLLWDGRDEDGDHVATGVYLYKVFARAEGQALFVNNDAGVEKVVVIR